MSVCGNYRQRFCFLHPTTLIGWNKHGTKPGRATTYQRGTGLTEASQRSAEMWLPLLADH